MKPRELAGAILRAKCIYVWVAYAELIPFEEEEAETTVTEIVGPDGEIEREIVETTEVVESPDDEEPEEEYDGELEEVGLWLAVKRVQAKEIVKHAYDDEDIQDIEAFEENGELYIGLGPVADEEDGESEAASS